MDKEEYKDYIDDREGLYELLDIEEASDFQYFENLAALLEYDGEIRYEILAELVEKLDLSVLSELFKSYFDELTNYVPGSESEIYSLIENIGMALRGLAGNSDENTVVNLTEELEKFRLWYSRDSKVYCTALGEYEEECMPVRDALVLSRLEKLQGKKYSYDFSEALDYQIDEYIMSFKDMIEGAGYEGDEDSVNDGTDENDDDYNDGFEIVGGSFGYDR